MLKIGVKKIGFSKKGRLSNQVFNRSNVQPLLPAVNSVAYIDFVQESAVLTDESVDDEKGVYHKITLDFTIRGDIDDNLDKIENYVGKPVVITVLAVDGNYYIIGSNKEPAYITKRNSYNGLKDRNAQITCEYINLNGLLEYHYNLSYHQSIGVAVNQQVVRVPWQGGSGNIFVESEEEWNVENLNS